MRALALFTVDSVMRTLLECSHYVHLIFICTFKREITARTETADPGRLADPRKPANDETLISGF